MMIAVLGLGFVGLTTALGLAEIAGHDVYGYDIDTVRRNNIKQNTIPFHEPYLEQYLNKHNHKLFHITDSLKEAITKSEIIFVCVGTPSDEQGKADTSILINCVSQCLEYIDKDNYKTIVIKSSVPPTTTSEVIKPFIEDKGFKVGEDIGLTTNPEFLREGYAWEDFIYPDRIVIGQSDDKSGNMVEAVYKAFKCPICKVSLNTGEYIKYLSNNLLSTLISFSNEMAMIADALGDIDVPNAFKVLHMDKRFNGEPAKISTYIYPGCGYGGYCLPKDTSALHSMARTKGYNAELIKDVIDINHNIKDHVVNKIIKSCDKESTIGILGLSFKPNSDDVRDTPSKVIIEKLTNCGYTNIMAYDPLAVDSFKKKYELPISYRESLDDIVNNSDILVLLTAWEEFVDNKDKYKNKIIIDARYVL